MPLRAPESSLLTPAPFLLADPGGSNALLSGGLVAPVALQLILIFTILRDALV